MWPFWTHLRLIIFPIERGVLAENCVTWEIAQHLKTLDGVDALKITQQDPPNNNNLTLPSLSKQVMRVAQVVDFRTTCPQSGRETKRLHAAAHTASLKASMS